MFIRNDNRVNYCIDVHLNKKKTLTTLNIIDDQICFELSTTYTL